MAQFSFTHEWKFPSNNYGQICGIANSGVETFNDNPIKSLAREICQNSLDARFDAGKPTRLEFRTFEISPGEIPDFDIIEDAFKRGMRFWSTQRTDKARKFFNMALKIAGQDKVLCLRISDFNTTGLTGSREEYNSPWCDLTKSTGTSDKIGSKGGSFGIGKYAPFSCSMFRTVFYSTSDINGICAYQGVSRLTSFKDKNGEITQGIGFYGNDKNKPVYEQISLDPNFNRDLEDYGTDIFILAFKGDHDWKEKMVASILDGFLYAIYTERLIADVDGIIVSKATLPSLVVSHKDYFSEHADEYYHTLIDEENARVFEKDIQGDAEIAGHLKLKMLIMPEYHRRVAMVRQTGMKIKDKGNISGLIPFAGVLYIEGDAINSYLRNLENPQHLDWLVERADNKRKAKDLLSFLNKFIRESLDEMKNDDSEDAIDPAVGEYLSAEDSEETDNNKDRAENISNNISSLKVRVTEARPKPFDTQEGKEASSEIDDQDGIDDVSELSGVGDSDGKGTGSKGGNGGGNAPGEGGGKQPVERRRAPSLILPASIRNIIRNKESGEYTVFFTPSSAAENGRLDMFMSAESQNYEAKILEAKCEDCPDISFDGNRISNLDFDAGKMLRIDIRLDYADYCSLEVKAYGNKI